jgi:hypothetical protein
MKPAKTSTTPPAAAPTQTGAEALIIGSLKFTEVAAQNQPRGVPTITFRGNAENKNKSTLSFNGAAIAATPELAKVARVRVFAAEGKPSLAIFPCAADEGTSFLVESAKSPLPRKKIQGRVLASLAAYSRVTYRIEAIESPRKGWLLVATGSERHA